MIARLRQVFPTSLLDALSAGMSHCAYAFGERESRSTVRGAPGWCRPRREGKRFCEPNPNAHEVMVRFFDYRESEKAEGEKFRDTAWDKIIIAPVPHPSGTFTKPESHLPASRETSKASTRTRNPEKSNQGRAPQVIIYLGRFDKKTFRAYLDREESRKKIRHVLWGRNKNEMEKTNLFRRAPVASRKGLKYCKFGCKSFEHFNKAMRPTYVRSHLTMMDLWKGYGREGDGGLRPGKALSCFSLGTGTLSSLDTLGGTSSRQLNGPRY